MTLNEIEDAYHIAIQEARGTYRKAKLNYLRESGFVGKARRKEDGKIGYLGLNRDNRIVFYPTKKDGTTSLQSGGWFMEDMVNELFEPYEAAEV